jgi:EmrB/QacA subfamily drug resistance transporter
MAPQGGEGKMQITSKQQRSWTLAVVSLATAMLMLDIAVVNTAITDMGRDLHTGLDGLKWVVDAYTLALAAVVLTTGSLADRLGRRRVFAAGMVVFTLASAAAAAATDITMLNIIRAVQGLGAAAMFATSMALLAHEFPQAQERAKALGVYGATIGGSFAFGPLVGGALTSGFGWRSIFIINIPIGIAALAITRRYVRESRDPQPRRIDWAGQTTLTAALFLLVLGLLRGNDVGWGSSEIVAELSASVVLIAIFALIERRVKDPMLPLGLFRIPSFSGAQISAFSISASLFAVYIYATIYMQQVLGLSAIEAGLAYIPGTILNAATSGVTAGLAEKGKLSSRTMVSAGLAMVATGLLLMTAADANSSWLAIQPGLMIAMIGTGMFNPAVIAVALGSVSEDQSGLAAGVNDTFRQAGIAVGVAALGAMIPTTALAKGDVTSYVDGLHNALIAGGALAAVGALAAAYLIRPVLQARREPAVPVQISEVALEPCA